LNNPDSKPIQTAGFLSVKSFAGKLNNPDSKPIQTAGFLSVKSFAGKLRNLRFDLT